MITSFNKFILEDGLKNKATLNIKNQTIVSSLYLKDVGIAFRDSLFEFDVGIVKLQLIIGKYWVVYINQNYFGS